MNLAAGILLFRFSPGGEPEFLLVHPGGPFWKNRDTGAWSIPKGQPLPGESMLEAAQREFEEEIGVPVDGQFVEIGTIQQKGGKIVHGFAVNGDWSGPLATTTFATFEYPPRSGKTITVPEIDDARFFPLAEARAKINPAQAPFLDRLLRELNTTLARR